MISIVTPCYQMAGYLKRCRQSVKDQSGVSVEHLVIDGGSKDETVEFLQNEKGIRWVSEPDQGMYDALNKGFSLSTGEIIGHLNADEQYLPGTLEYVETYFQTHPEVDVIFGDAILVRPDGSAISFRKGYQPRKVFILASHLYVYTCTMFFRRKIIDNGLHYDRQFKSIGDMKFVLDIINKGYQVRHVHRYFSTFTMTGNNLSQQKVNDSEFSLIMTMRFPFFSVFKPLINFTRLFFKLASGSYYEKIPLSYHIFPQSGTKREIFKLEKYSPFFKET